MATERLSLVPLRGTDCHEMAAVLSDPSLYVFTGGEPPSVAELEERYTFQVAGSPRPGEVWHNWIVRLDDVAIGYVQATVVGDSAELAWVIGVPWQGRGYASEASAAMCDWLKLGGVSKLEAHIHPAHETSAGVARKLGLGPSGEVDDEGEVVWR